jgi:uncharacterized protein YecE (DUF72 family)
MMQVRVGIAGWSYPDWEGIVYPTPKPSRFDPLCYLVRYFDTIEVNSTFYHPPSVKNTTSWAKRCRDNPNFRFTVKLFKGFTHDRTATSADRVTVKRGLAPLVEHDRLGALLIQFPWSFKSSPDSRLYLDRLLEDFNAYHPVIEVRHASWNEPEFFEHLADRGAGFCNIDQPRIGRSLGPTDKTTGTVGYVRLHGRNYKEWFREDAGRDSRYDYFYSEDELDPWLEKIERVAEDSSETFVITNNHFRGKAAANALQIKAKLKRRKVPAPRSLVNEYPVLESIASPEGAPSQGTLF